MSFRDFFCRLAGKSFLQPFWDCWADFGVIVKFPGIALLNDGERGLARLESFLDASREKGFSFVSIDELAAMLVEGKPVRKVMALTFDEGGRSLFENVLPILKSKDVPVLVYLPTDFAGVNGLQPEELVRYASDPFVTFGWQMPTTVVRAQTDGAFRQEIVKAQAIFEAIGIKTCHLSYSSNQPAEVTAVLGKALADFGVRTATTDQQGVVLAGADAFALPRLVVSSENSPYEALARHVFSAGED